MVDTSSGSTSFTEGGGAVTVDGAVTPSDIDDTNLESAVVRISTNFESGDTLAFTNQNGISGNYSSGTGVLTLTGTSSVANYETALRSITYDHTGNNPQGGKTVGFKVNDGDADSAEDFKTINIAGTNDGPAINTSASTLAYTEGDGAVPADPGLTLTDPENDNISGATVQITGNHVQAEDELAFVNQNGITGNYNDATGTLTLSGTTTVANYQTALRSVTYREQLEQPVDRHAHGQLPGNRRRHAERGLERGHARHLGGAGQRRPGRDALQRRDPLHRGRRGGDDRQRAHGDRRRRHEHRVGPGPDLERVPVRRHPQLHQPERHLRQLQLRHRRAHADRHELGRQLRDGDPFDHLRDDQRQPGRLEDDRVQGQRRRRRLEHADQGDHGHAVQRQPDAHHVGRQRGVRRGHIRTRGG